MNQIRLSKKRFYAFLFIIASVTTLLLTFSFIYSERAKKVHAVEGPTCGNGVIDPGEDCEKNNDCGTNEYCSGCTCYARLLCGNGVIDPGEDCESNNDCGTDEYCSASCLCRANPLCGNGVINPGESCESDDDCNDDYECSGCHCLPPYDPCPGGPPSLRSKHRCVGNNLVNYTCYLSLTSECAFTFWDSMCNATYCCRATSTYMNHPSCFQGLYPNPPLPEDACGLNIALVLDNSESIDAGELELMKSAFRDFVDSLQGTPTMYSVIKFNTRAEIIQDFTYDTTLVKNAINSTTTSKGITNWDEALEKTRDVFGSIGDVDDGRGEYFDLTIFASDGNANTYGRGTWDELHAIEYAEEESKWLKYNGVRIFGIGIGDDLDVENLKTITGPNADKPNILASDLVTVDFETLAQKLSVFARSACQGTITINKYLENEDLSLKGGEGWEYSIGGPETKNLSTRGDGSINSGNLEEGTYSVVETNVTSTQYFYNFAQCEINEIDEEGNESGYHSIGSPTTNGVQGITMTDQDMAYCNFLNTSEPPNEDPIVESISVQRERENDVYGFTSTTHSGTKLNNTTLNSGESAKTEVTAKFSDADGVDDLQALAVWWTGDGDSFIAPNQLGDNENPKTQDGKNFGIMIKRDINKVLREVYIPSYRSKDDYSWVKAGNVGQEPIYIVSRVDGGNNEIKIVEISGIQIVEGKLVEEVNTEIDLRFVMRFLTPEENTYFEKVNTGAYSVYGVAYDTYNFVTYGGTEILGLDMWGDEPATWNIDLIKPTANPIQIFYDDDGDGINENQIRATVTGESNDNMKIAGVRLDACSDAHSGKTLTVNTLSYTLNDCTGGIFGRADFDFTKNNSLLYSNASGVNITNVNKNDFDIASQYINLGTMTEDSITFYLTVMDYAGNYHQSVPYILRLGDWVVVEDGLVFGKSGTDSWARTGDRVSDWDYDPIDIILKDMPVKESYDLTNHALLGSVLSTNSLKELIKPLKNLSFKASNYKSNYDSSTFNDLVNAYEVKSMNPRYGEKNINGGTISNNFLDAMGSDCNITNHDYCTLVSNGTLNITGPGNFVCDHKCLIIVNGDLNINTNFVNNDSDDACIILVSGDVNIDIGNAINTGNAVDYDTIESFVIAGKNIDIAEDLEYDGLFIEGGLVGLEIPSDVNDPAIVNEKDIVYNKLNTFPVIVVKCRSKYGLLAKKLFGTPIDVFKSEVGFKPY